MKIETYSMLRGVGDGEPIASDKFEVGGHEWVSKSPSASKTMLEFAKQVHGKTNSFSASSRASVDTPGRQ